MRKQRFYLCSAFGMWFADEWPNSGAYLIRTLHLGQGGYSQAWKMHTPLIVFDSMHSMVTVLVHGFPLFYQECNHKKLPKPLSGQRQTTDKKWKTRTVLWRLGSLLFLLPSASGNHIWARFVEDCSNDAQAPSSSFFHICYNRGGEGKMEEAETPWGKLLSPFQGIAQDNPVPTWKSLF